MLQSDYKTITYRAFPNVLQSDKWVFSFSNIPTLPDMVDMRYFDSYIKSFVLPDYNLETINIDGPFGWQIRHPLGGSFPNKNLSQIQVEFKVSEDMLNYMVVLDWMRRLRYGDTEQEPGELFRRFDCNAAYLQVLDNQKRVTTEIKFTKLLPSSMSSLSLAYETSSELSFTVNFSYEEVLYSMKDPMVGGANPTAPETISPCGVSAVPLTPVADWN